MKHLNQKSTQMQYGITLEWHLNDYCKRMEAFKDGWMDGWMNRSACSSIIPHPLFGPFGTKNGATIPTRPHNVVKQIIGKASECETIATLVRYTGNIIKIQQWTVQYSTILTFTNPLLTPTSSWMGRCYSASVRDW